MKTTRRTFLGAAAAATAAWTGTVRSAEKDRTLKLGVIGVGWYGMVDAKAALKAGGAEIAAICDVDSEHLAKSAEELQKLQGKRPHTCTLYEELLGQKGLDAVIIATPPQWHALQFIAAVERGLDVYCEKPIAYDVREGRAMVEAQIHYAAGTKDPTPQAPPASLDWDLWCGPGPKIPYSPQVGHLNWRLEKTTGHGHLVDWGIHLVDACRTILGVSTPRRVTAVGGLYVLRDKITTPDTLTVTFEFDRCPVVWRHRIWGAEEYLPDVNNGIFLYGEQGTIFVTDNRLVLIPKGKNKERQEQKLETDAGLAHMADFLDAVRIRRPPTCSMEDGYRSTATVQLAMISYESSSPVVWNEASEQILDNPSAARLLKREYRAPWKHPYSGGS